MVPVMASTAHLPCLPLSLVPPPCSLCLVLVSTLIYPDRRSQDGPLGLQVDIEKGPGSGRVVVSGLHPGGQAERLLGRPGEGGGGQAFSLVGGWRDREIDMGGGEEGGLNV